MEIRRGHMIPLGYGKFWRSDDIVGLMPIENGRGPGRRTEVYVSSLDEPLVASRGQRSILSEMAYTSPGEQHAARLRETLSDVLDALGDITAAQRLILGSDSGFDVETWEKRLRDAIALRPEGQADADQGDLFG